MDKRRVEDILYDESFKDSKYDNNNWEQLPLFHIDDLSNHYF